MALTPWVDALMDAIAIPKGIPQWHCCPNDPNLILPANAAQTLPIDA